MLTSLPPTNQNYRDLFVGLENGPMPPDISWKQLGLQILAFPLIGGLVYVLTKIMQFRYRGWHIADAKQSAWYALAAIW